MPSQIGFGKTLRDYIFQVVINTEKQLPVFTAGDFSPSSFKDEDMLKPLGLLPQGENDSADFHLARAKLSSLITPH